MINTNKIFPYANGSIDEDVKIIDIISQDDKGNSHITCVCPRCGGTGKLTQFNHIEEGVCFKCVGTGIMEIKSKKLYTKEEIEEKSNSYNQNWESNKIKEFAKDDMKEQIKRGFKNGYVYALVSNSDNSENGIWNNILDTYVYNTEVENTVKIEYDDIVTYKLIWDDKDITRPFLDWDKINKIKDILNPRVVSKSNYIGQIKDKIQIEVKIKNIIDYSTQWGTGRFYIFEDNNSNILKWSTSTCLYNADDKLIKEDDIITLKATIKGHEEYKEEKQTVITRCKVIE